MGCPIRKSTDQSLFAAPHGLSQRITSFIACACQGIHQMPLYHLIIPIANVHLFGRPFTPIPSVGIVCTGRGSLSDPTAGRPTQATSGDASVWCLLVACLRGVAGLSKREVFMGCILIPRQGVCLVVRAPQTRGMCNPCRVLQRYSRANPFWRKDWRKTSFLRRSPMPRGQAWQSKQGSPFLWFAAAFFRMRPQTQGVRAIPAVHDVYPVG